MKLIVTLTLVLGFLFGDAVHAQNADAASQAEIAALQWLKLTDSADYSATWEQSAGLFKAAVSKESWESAIRSVRAPLGAVQSRKLKSAQFTRTLAGAPDGEYVVIQFETQFAHKSAAVETVTSLKEKDGSWRVSGYFIK
ncbi:DUF4019 domain-containing protein [uncultured Halomonas sp.]|uniref:DUF4019 domain-containing protein n=1 Tax=uncultured Halomonas sp. TaxID=173971 RepID=UPI00261D3BD6|nr:DUF4019 domain-containing protein [uncultured Halomonas sp.]